MDNKVSSLFETPVGMEIFSSALSAVEEYGMQKMISGGVLVGLSGGADSVMLLCFLYEYRRRYGNFPILAVHINHSIRGESADRDEKYSRDICSALGIEFVSKKIDVPTIAKEEGIGIEECARNVRYSQFDEIISGRADIYSVAVAHNANDNLETVIFNMFRGSGLRGVSGIQPVRDNIFRPLINVKKENIIKALDISGISYVTDETNEQTDYRRNYIRHKLVPLVYGICDEPIGMVSRLSSNLRIDDEYLCAEADKILGDEKTLECNKVRGLHKAILSRVLLKFAKNNEAELSFSIINSLIPLLDKDNFSYSLPGSKVFVCEAGICRINAINKPENYDFCFKITGDITELSGFDADFLISNDKIDKTCLNVYKSSIQAKISSAIIEGDLVLRSRRDGDTIYYGGMTRRVKKLFCDLKIPRTLRKSIPLLCDGKGVLWIPGLGSRDDGKKGTDIYVCLGIGKGDALSDVRMRSVSEFKSEK